MWTWPRLRDLEITQNKYFRRLLLLPFCSPMYLIQAVLGLEPVKYKLLFHTFNFWAKSKSPEAKPRVEFWLNHWLANPNLRANSLQAFFEILKTKYNSTKSTKPVLHRGYLRITDKNTCKRP